MEGGRHSMHAARFSLATLVLAALRASIVPAAAQAMTVDEFRRELVGVPLCGTPESGPLAGKALCTVHLPDGTAILAGAGLDVFENEPAVNPKLVKLARAGKVVLLPHMGSATIEGRIDMGDKVIINIRTFMDGHRPPDRVLPSML